MTGDFRFSVRAWRVLASTPVLVNRWLNLRRDACERPDGGLVDEYYVLSEPDVACVVALTGDRQCLLVEQYKHGIGRACLEIPGGLFDEADADPLAVAERELREETGFMSERWLKLGVLAISPSRTPVQMHLFAALDCRRVGDQSLDPNEEIIVHQRPLAEALALVQDGTINAATSVAGLLLAATELRERGLVE
ncbi:MAG: NUDIX hydrolase [Anaerolineae bacterium]|nr:NUDIX hydrolase [Anaerolineae bacterium]